MICSLLKESDPDAQRDHLCALIYDAERAQQYIEVDRLRGILDDPAQFAAWLSGDLGPAPTSEARRYVIRTGG